MAVRVDPKQFLDGGFTFFSGHVLQQSLDFCLDAAGTCSTRLCPAIPRMPKLVVPLLDMHSAQQRAWAKVVGLKCMGLLAHRLGFSKIAQIALGSAMCGEDR